VRLRLRRVVVVVVVAFVFVVVVVLLAEVTGREEEEVETFVGCGWVCEGVNDGEEGFIWCGCGGEEEVANECATGGR
jgi:hypothetical protein